MKKLLNILYYKYYKVDVLFENKIENGIHYTLKDFNIKVEKTEHNNLKEKDNYYALYSTLAIKMMIIILTLFISSIFLNLLILFQITFSNKFIIVVILSSFIALLIKYFFITKNDKHLIYFDHFETKSKKWQNLWSWITILLTFSIFLLFFLTLLQYKD